KEGRFPNRPPLKRRFVNRRSLTRQAPRPTDPNHLRRRAPEPISTLAVLGKAGRYRSGQTGRTVNPLAYAFSGSNPLLPTLYRAQLSTASFSSRRASFRGLIFFRRSVSPSGPSPS